ncbi:hypothetical protein FRB98_000157 [Tulasnella sp. 332]|nr:hypothetical protein FRB98_000157 [Tulasnella sp. 332]
MHSVYQRVNNLSAFLTSCLFVLSGLIAATTFLLQPSSATVSNGSVISAEHLAVATKRLGWNRRNYEVQNLNFNVTADLSPLFNWNTKQLFVYITADYEHTQKGIDNRVVIWDKIVRDRESAKINLTKIKPKYPLRDYSKSFKYALPASYSLHYDVMPWIGVLTSGTAGTSVDPVSFPTSKLNQATM